MVKPDRQCFTKLRSVDSLSPDLTLFTEVILMDPNGKLVAGYFRIRVSG
jgi:hypothetical protein